MATPFPPLSDDAARLAALGLADALIFRSEGDRLALVGGTGRGQGWGGIVETELGAEPLVERARAGSRPMRVEAAEAVHVVGPYWSAHAALVPVGEQHLVVLGSTTPVALPDEVLQQVAAELVAANVAVSPAKLLADELELVPAIRGLMEYRPERVADTARHIAATTAEALSCEVGVVLVAAHGSTICEVVVRDWPDAPSPARVEAAATALLERVRAGTLLEQELAARTDDALGRGSGLVARLVLPIGEPAQALGLLAIAHADIRPRGFTNLCQRIGHALAEAAELLLSQAISREALSAERDRFAREARTDPLTGLANRARWDEVLEAEAERVERYGRPCSVVSVDVDGLKRTNDQHGHAAGDQLIRAAAQVLALEARATDAVARVGGDEFLVLLPEADEAGAGIYLDRVRAAASAWRDPEGRLSLLLSLGAATARSGAELRAAVHLADERMYERKHGVDEVGP